MGTKYDSDIVGWITRGGKRIPIRKGDGKGASKPMSSEDDVIEAFAKKYGKTRDYAQKEFDDVVNYNMRGTGRTEADREYARKEAVKDFQERMKDEDESVKPKPKRSSAQRRKHRDKKNLEYNQEWVRKKRMEIESRPKNEK